MGSMLAPSRGLGARRGATPTRGGTNRGRPSSGALEGRVCGAAFAAAALALLLGVAGCTRSAPRHALVLGTSRQLSFALVFIAEAKGFFADERLRVDQRRFATGRDALDALIRGEVEAATAFDTPVVLRAAAVPDLEVLTTLHVSSRYTRIVARRDRGVRTEADLRGKRVAAPRGTSGEYLLHHVLRLSGVEPSEVALVDLGPEALGDALVSGRVDAISTWSPHAELAAERLGADATVEITSDMYTEASMLITRTEVRHAREEALVRFVRALARAERLVEADPEGALAAIRPEFPELTPAELRDRWERLTLELGLSSLLELILGNQVAWFRAARAPGFSPPDVQRLLVPDVLARVDDQAVTFVAAPAPSPAR